MVDFTPVDVGQYEHRNYGVLADRCIIALNRFALVLTNQYDLPTPANSRSGTSGYYFGCGYRKGGFMTLIIDNYVMPFFIEIRKCKLDKKKLVIETYSETNSNASVALWFNMGSIDNPLEADWHQLNSATAGYMMAYRSETFIFRETKSLKFWKTIEIANCKKCNGGKCQFCTLDGTNARFYALNKKGVKSVGTFFGSTNAVQFNFDNQVFDWTDTVILLKADNQSQDLYYDSDGTPRPSNLIGNYSWVVTDDRQPDIIISYTLDCGGIHIKTSSGIDPDPFVNQNVRISDSMGGWINAKIRSITDNYIDLYEISSSYLAFRQEKLDTISDLHFVNRVAHNEYGVKAVYWHSGLCNLQQVKTVKLVFEGQWYLDSPVTTLYAYFVGIKQWMSYGGGVWVYEDWTTLSNPQTNQMNVGFNLATVLAGSTIPNWVDNHVWLDIHEFLSMSDVNRYFKIGANMTYLIKEAYITIDPNVHTYLPKHTFVDQAACDAYFLDPLYAAEKVGGLNVYFGISTKYWNGSIWSSVPYEMKLWQLDDDAGWLSIPDTWLPEHVFVDEDECNFYFEDPAHPEHAAEKVWGLNVLIDGELWWWDDPIWQETHTRVYADDVARDAYFDVNPGTFVDGLKIIVAEKLFEYNQPVWTDKNHYVKGDGREFMIGDGITEFEFTYPWFKDPSYADAGGNAADLKTGRAFGGIWMRSGLALPYADIVDKRCTLDVTMSLKTEVNGVIQDFNPNEGLTYIKKDAKVIFE